MSKTYTLNGTARGGTYGSWSSNIWSNLYPFRITRVGSEKISDTDIAMRCTSIMFDEATLTKLRSKRIISIKLSLTVSSKPSAGTERFALGYKFNNSTTDWRRTNSDQSDAGAYTITYIRGTGSHTESGGTLVLDMGTSVPKYGYVAGPEGYLVVDTYIDISGTPVLTVVTDETDIWLNNGGTWVQGYPWVNDGGTWKQGSRVWVNNNGTWVSTS